MEQLNQPLEVAESYLKAGNESASKFLDAGKVVKVLDIFDSLTRKAILRQVGRYAIKRARKYSFEEENRITNEGS